MRRTEVAWSFTECGEAALEDLAEGEWSRFGRAVLQTGAYDDQIGALLEVGAVVAGVLRVPLARLPRVAPTAGAILAWSSVWRHDADLVVPLSEIEDLLAVAVMDQAAKVPEWVTDAQTIGWRAELYSLRMERARAGVHQVLHVSRDIGDQFGYDIEDTTADPSRLIEVKGSRGSRVRFTITARELEAARRHPTRYEIQYWGDMVLSRDPRTEFELLISRGYPTVLRDVASSIDGGLWASEPRAWRITV